MEAAFQNQTAGDVRVEGLDVRLTLRSTAELGEVSEGVQLVELRCGVLRITGCRHSASSYEGFESASRRFDSTDFDNAPVDGITTRAASRGSSFNMPPPSACPSSSQLS